MIRHLPGVSFIDGARAAAQGKASARQLFWEASCLSSCTAPRHRIFCGMREYEKGRPAPCLDALRWSKLFCRSIAGNISRIIDGVGSCAALAELPCFRSVHRYDCKSRVHRCRALRGVAGIVCWRISSSELAGFRSSAKTDTAKQARDSSLWPACPVHLDSRVTDRRLPLHGRICAAAHGRACRLRSRTTWRPWPCAPLRGQRFLRQRLRRRAPSPCRNS